ncbi:hypothetical protein Pmani_034887 [Petrolisthes manimaculis]|uniref:Uncharacterized protein n=1 Tax=Petrolisthes manimaculis TaxID=1843537 RepID=A0AAE1NMQ6_9EUCA|nr:hypothetical protein Pmani_034887 [Petrolisthes manimaculis]
MLSYGKNEKVTRDEKKGEKRVNEWSGGEESKSGEEEKRLPWMPLPSSPAGVGVGGGMEKKKMDEEGRRKKWMRKGEEKGGGGREKKKVDEEGR